MGFNLYTKTVTRHIGTTYAIVPAYMLLGCFSYLIAS